MFSLLYYYGALLHIVTWLHDFGGKLHQHSIEMGLIKGLMHGVP